MIMPPLRAMREDIVLLATHFLDQFRREQGKGRLELSPSSLRCLETYEWPGNVHELAHEMKRLAVLARGPVVEASDLSAEIRRAEGNPTALAQAQLEGASLKVAVAELEQQMLKAA